MCYEQIRGIIVKNTPALLLLLLLLPPAILLVFSFSPVENYFFSSSDSGFQRNLYLMFPILSKVFDGKIIGLLYISIVLDSKGKKKETNE